MNRSNSRRIDRFAMFLHSNRLFFPSAESICVNSFREDYSAIYFQQYVFVFKKTNKEKKQSDEEIVRAQCLPAGACFFNGQLTKWPFNEPDKSSSSSIQYLYMHYHRKWVVDWPSALCTCTVRIISLCCLFVRFSLYYFSFLSYSFFHLYIFFSPLFAFCLLKRRTSRPEGHATREISDVPSRSATPDSSGFARPMHGIDSRNETFKSSLISIR